MSDMLPAILQMAAALAVLVGTIFLAKSLATRLGRSELTGMRPRHIRLVETRYLGPRKSLLLVEVGGEYLLLSAAGERIDLVKKVEVLEEIEVIDDGRAGFGERLERLVKGRKR